MLIGSWNLRNQLLKCVCRPLSREDWELGISVCSPCTEPWGDSWLRTVSLFATVCGYMNTSPAFHQKQVIKGPWVAATKSRMTDMCLNSFQVDTGDLEQARGRT